MGKIVLNIKDENIDTVLNILGNLKDGLIGSIEHNAKKTHARYQPKMTTIIKENEKPKGKYLSPGQYRKAIKS